jgi:hypothetical protein
MQAQGRRAPGCARTVNSKDILASEWGVEGGFDKAVRLKRRCWNPPMTTVTDGVPRRKNACWMQASRSGRCWICWCVASYELPMSDQFFI